MPSRQAEQNANNALGAMLALMLPTCALRVENTRVIVGQSALRLDILITAPDRAPVVIEAEFMPAADALQNGIDRAVEALDDMGILRRDNPLHSRSARNVRRPPDPPYGLRHHRQWAQAIK